MNKISNINLGGFPFTIDEDAYQALDKYLKTIHKHFRKSEGYEEITTDIETRMAELFQEKLEGRPIVTSPDVKNVIAIMGPMTLAPPVPCSLTIRLQLVSSTS